MNQDSLCFSSLSQLAEEIRRGVVSPVEITQAYLDRIQTIDAKLNSYLTITAEHALRVARAAEKDIRQGHDAGPLHGIPLAYKDIFATQGVKTTCASKVLQDYVPDHDATVIKRLQAAGAVMLGKLNMNEFATVSPSVFFGRVNNPWNLEHGPGGSSSGSGVAVAAGLCAGSLGTDTAGSIRIPASFCGIVGLKPTYGRVSLHGVIPLSWSLDHAGPMTRTVKDAALMLQAIAGYDPQDLASSETAVPDFTAGLTGEVSGLTLGVPRSFFPDLTDPEVKDAFASAVRVLEDLGVRIEEVLLPPMDGIWTGFARPILSSEAYVWHEPYLQKQAEDYGPYVRKFFERGRDILAKDYVQCQRAKAQFRRDVLAACASVDALLTPGTLIPAPPHNARSLSINGKAVSLVDAIISATGPFDLTGQPALSVPCGFTRAGLPLALQIVGKPFDEATVLRIGHAYEVHTSWHERRPPALD